MTDFAKTFYMLPQGSIFFCMIFRRVYRSKIQGVPFKKLEI
jgi:hypothetical protein